MSFDTFVQAYMTNPRPDFADVGSQSQFFRTRSNGRGATHIFKYENQGKILDFTEARLNMQIDLPQENVSPPGDLTLTPETRQKFCKRHAEEFALHDAAL